MGSPHLSVSSGLSDARVFALVLVASLPACGRIEYEPHDTGALDDAGRPSDAAIDASLDPLADAAIDASSSADTNTPDTNDDAGACGITIRWFRGPGDDALARVVHTPDGGQILMGQFSTPSLVGDLTAGRFLARIEGEVVRWQRSGSFFDVEGDADGVLVLEDDAAYHLSPAGTMDRSLGAAVGAIGAGQIAGRGAGAVVAVSNIGALTWSGTSIMTTSGSSDVAVVVLDGSGAVLTSAVGGDAYNDTVFDVAGAMQNTRVFMAPAGCSADDASFVLTLDGTPPRPLTFLGPDLVQLSTGLAVDPAGNVYLAGASATTSAAASGALRWSTGAIVNGVATYDPTTNRLVVAGLLFRPTTFSGTTLSPLGVTESLVVVWLDATTGALVRHEIVGDGMLGIGDLDLTPAGEVVVVGSTSDPFGVCGAPRPIGGGASDAFLLTFAP